MLSRSNIIEYLKHWVLIIVQWNSHLTSNTLGRRSHH